MTLISELIKNSSSEIIDQEYENEKLYFWSLSKIKNFNSRKCGCCDCLDDCDIRKDWENKDKYCGNIGNKYVCYSHWENEEEEYCECKCLYPTICDNPVQIDEETQFKLICLLKDKKTDLYPDYHNFDYINKNTMDTNSKWNLSLIEIFDISLEQIKEYEAEMSISKLKTICLSYNVLRIMSGMNDNYNNS